MLPYTPLHHLLLRELDGAAAGHDQRQRSDEPIAYEDGDALDRLAGIADLFLTHDRPIHLRCDDSVTRVVGGRRAADAALARLRPAPLIAAGRLPRARPSRSAASLKATFALGRGRHAFLSHHLGDLDHYEAYRAYVEAIAHYERLFAFQPESDRPRPAPRLRVDALCARDMRARRPTFAVQHHHAHMASCMADNGLDEPVIGVTFDGTGFGTDGAIWGGEFLIGDYRGFRRAAHLRTSACPAASRRSASPGGWRRPICRRRAGSSRCCRIACSRRRLATVERMIERRFNSPDHSSAGRLFDAVAALAGVRDRVSYEGQAAMELEWLATEVVAADGVYPFDWSRIRWRWRRAAGRSTRGR